MSVDPLSSSSPGSPTQPCQTLDGSPDHTAARDGAPPGPDDGALTEHLEILDIGADVLDTSDGIQHLSSTLESPGSAQVTPQEHSKAPNEPCDTALGRLTQSGELEPPRPFHKWMRTLHRRAKQRPSVLGIDGAPPPRESFGSRRHESVSPHPSSHRKSSSSGSSFRFVSAVRSASASLASVSIMARSKRTAARSQCVSRTDRSSRASMCGPRASEESGMLERGEIMDAAALERSVQRRRILEELLSTEEGYIGDVRFLVNVSNYAAKVAIALQVLTLFAQVYVTILASLPAVCMGLRASINQNLAEIIELHEEILGEVQRLIPHSEYTQVETPARERMTSNQARLGPQGHRRWASSDAAVARRQRISWLQSTPGMLCEPHVGAEVAKVFAKKV